MSTVNCTINKTLQCGAGKWKKIVKSVIQYSTMFCSQTNSAARAFSDRTQPLRRHARDGKGVSSPPTSSPESPLKWPWTWRGAARTGWCTRTGTRGTVPEHWGEIENVPYVHYLSDLLYIINNNKNHDLDRKRRNLNLKWFLSFVNSTVHTFCIR